MARTQAGNEANAEMRAADEEMERAREMQNAAMTADAKKQADQMMREAERKKQKAVEHARKLAEKNAKTS